jgi:putative DNA primase/helicase
VTPAERVLARLDRVRRNGSGWSARCPAHEDRIASLSVSEGDDGRALVHCHAGCALDTILAACELTAPDLFPQDATTNTTSTVVATYQYADENNELLFEKLRYSPKRFVQRRPDGRGGWLYKLDGVRRVPYRLSELREGLLGGRWVFVSEGEKAADRLIREGFVATCGSGGAGKWRAEYAEHFAGAKVAVLADNDEPGRKHALDVARSLHGVAKVVKLVELPGLRDKEDVFDWFERDGTPERLRALVTEATETSNALDIPDEVSTQVDTTPGLLSVRVSDVEAERVRWLWPGRLPAGKLVVLDGDPGLGKSTLTLDFASRVSTGTPWPDQVPCPAGAVVVMSAEDAVGDTIRPRLEAVDADLDRVHVIEGVHDNDRLRSFTIPGDLARLEGLTTEVGALLVVVDVLAAYLHGSVDSYRDQDVRGALMPLAQLAGRTGATVVVLRHLSKGGGANAVYRGGGSIGIIGAARAGMLVAADPEDDSRRILAMTKSNLAAMPPALAYRLVNDELRGVARVQWDGATTYQAADLLGMTGPEERSAIAEACEVLTDLLAHGPLPQAEVKAATERAGASWATVRRAKDRLRVRSLKVGRPGEPGEWRWALPPEDAHDEPEDAEDAHAQSVNTFGNLEHLREPDERLAGQTDALDTADPDRGQKIADLRAEDVRRRRAAEATP